MKVVIIGAASGCFGRGQIADLLVAKELRGRDVELHLVDIDAPALETMAKVAERIRQHTGSDIRLHLTTDRTEALPGADYVIVAVARKRYELWEQDYRVPLAHGFRHCLGENGGPGAVFHAMRSLHMVIPMCRDIERLCPNALMLNFTNPEARVLNAILTLTKVKAAGICHGVFGALRAVERYLQRPIVEFDVVSAGMNHFYCLLQVKDRKTGQDRLSELVQMAAADTTRRPLFRKMAEIFGVFGFPSDDHTGEYLSYGSEFEGVKWKYGLESRAVDWQPKAEPKLEDYASGKRPVDEWLLHPSGEITAPVVIDMELNRRGRHAAVNVLNTEGYISNLPRTAVIEVPADVDGAGIHPIHVGDIPETYAAVMRTHFTIHALLTEAYRTGSKRLLLQALLLDPVVNSITAAQKMLDEMLELQKEYLPVFT